jgi:hypothetical protein
VPTPSGESITSTPHASSLRILHDAVLPFIKQSMHETIKGTLECDEEYEARNWLAFKLLPLIHSLVVTKHNLFSIGEARNHLPKANVHLLGRRFLNCIKSDIERKFGVFPNAQFNPWFRLISLRSRREGATFLTWSTG